MSLTDIVKGSVLRPVVGFFIAFVVGALASAAGCSSAGGLADAGPDAAATEGGACVACVTDQDCSGGSCVQIAGDTYCASACANGACGDGTACATVTSVAGDPVSVCAPTSGACAYAPPDAAAGGTCGALVGPATAAGCASCKGQSCQANGCYGGWWCDTSTKKCVAPPQTCAPTDAGPPFDAGPPPVGTVGPNGGSLSHLEFAVVGDTRPPVIDDTKNYPTAIITKIYQGVQATGAPFAVSTGDYMFASTYGTQASAQLALYLGARKAFAGPLFPALGNHECTGAVTSNCGQGTADGVTKNYAAFTSALLGPIQQPNPWYAIEVDHTQMAWTAKFVFIAGNAWSSAQAQWLQQAMAKPTTYTFVIRHEPQAATTAPGVTPSEQILSQYPYTLKIVGHTHTYARYGREVVVGNGGAPLTSGAGYGYAMINQRQDGAMQVDMIDWQTGQPDPSFRFAVKPNGSPAP